MKYKIVGDSSCDVTKEMEQAYNIAIAPLSFTLDGEEFIDDESLDLDNYLKKIAKSPNVPKSACPSITDYLDRFEGEHEWVFGVTISSELSGSYNSAMNAKAMYLESHPDKKVHIFNSFGASTMEVLIALKVVELAEAGKDFEAIVEEVEHYIDDAKVLFVLDIIDTLEKNGRMSSMKAKIVRILNLKLILRATQEGTIDMLGQARGTKKALQKMVVDMKKIGTISKDKIFAISHCNAPERAEYVKSLVQELYEFKDIIIVKMRGLSSTYANEGGIIISF
ncbi:MAG: DegV family protein [Vallitaleaceae bacterium]|jgi:DegV family protein with EDD domain|nr:DegV family protein [Vallitaleaceae bacterium]